MIRVAELEDAKILVSELKARLPEIMAEHTIEQSCWFESSLLSF